MKTAFCVGGYGCDNLTLTGRALDADILLFRDKGKLVDILDKNDMSIYDCVIIMDCKDYRMLQDLPARLRSARPNIFMGMHQESEWTNIFIRTQYENKTRYEGFSKSLIHTVKWFEATDFVICHNTESTKFYKVFSGGKPCFVTLPFLDIETEGKHFKSRLQKYPVILIGGSYNLREGGFLAYLMTKGIALRYGIYLETSARNWKISKGDAIEFKMVTDAFEPKVTHKDGLQHEPYVERLSRYYAIVWLMESTACRINAECAAIGTPIISLKGNVQNILWPELAIDKYDLEKGQKLLERLCTDTEFYEGCVEYAQANIHKVGIEASSKLIRDKVRKLYEKERCFDGGGDK